MNFHEQMMPPPGQFGGKEYDLVPGADPGALQLHSPYQDKADLHLGIGPGQFFERIPGQPLANAPLRVEQTAPTVTPNAFDLAAVLSMGAPMGGVYLFTLEQSERERRDERPLTRQMLTTPIAPLANLERSEFADPTQVYLV